MAPALPPVPPPAVPPGAPPGAPPDGAEGVSSVQLTAVGLVPPAPQRASQLGAQLVHALTGNDTAAAPRQVQLQVAAEAMVIIPKRQLSETRVPVRTFAARSKKVRTNIKRSCL